MESNDDFYLSDASEQSILEGASDLDDDTSMSKYPNDAEMTAILNEQIEDTVGDTNQLVYSIEENNPVGFPNEDIGTNLQVIPGLIENTATINEPTTATDPLDYGYMADDTQKDTSNPNPHVNYSTHKPIWDLNPGVIEDIKATVKEAATKFVNLFG